MQRLIFANQLRGLAAVAVICSHLIGAFWAMRDFVGLATASPVQSGDPPALYGLFSHTYLNFGPLGVGAFFLISGLVIPISLAQHNRATFLLARILRIYPTYVAALLIEVAVLRADAAYWGRPFPYSDWAILSNALLVHNLVGMPSIDMVNWTLAVEVKFYLLMALLAPQIRRGSVVTLFAVAASLLAANLLVGWPPLASRISRPDLAALFGMESVFLVFMLIGVLFNFAARGLIGAPALAASVAAMSALFVGCWLLSPMQPQMPVVTVNYFYAVILFAAMFCFRGRFRPVRVLDFVAKISFPLYLLHPLVGYSLIKWLMLRCNVGYLPALGITLAVLVGLASALHVVIESRAVAMGRRMARPPGAAVDPGALPVSL